MRSVPLEFAIDSGDVKESGMVKYGIDGPTPWDEVSISRQYSTS